MGADTNLADRVLTVKLNQHGTNVINKQVGTQPANHKHKLFLVIQKVWVYTLQTYGRDLYMPHLTRNCQSSIRLILNSESASWGKVNSPREILQFPAQNYLY